MEAPQRFRAICERITAGSEDAFKELYDALSARMFSYVVPRVGNREEALDLVQEIFLALWSARLRFTYENDAMFYGFVFTIARRTLAGHYEKRKRDAAIEELPQDDRYDMDTDALGDIHTIEKLLPKLSEDDRDVVTLRYWNGLSFDEIAEMKGKQETAVRVQHHRALEKLRQFLPNYES